MSNLTVEWQTDKIKVFVYKWKDDIGADELPCDLGRDNT